MRGHGACRLSRILLPHCFRDSAVTLEEGSGGHLVILDKAGYVGAIIRDTFAAGKTVAIRGFRLNQDPDYGKRGVR